MTLSMPKRPLCLIAALGLALAAPGVLAQSGADFPNKPIRLTVPYAPGGGTDLVMRALAPGMGEALGQPVVVDNKPGGGTINATELVAKSAPDGYNLLAVGAPIYLNTALGIKTPYDPLKDLVPVSLLVNNPSLLLVGSSVNAKNLKELVALSKSTKGGLSYASAGTGSIAHLGGELLKARLGLDMQHIPYKGSAPALTDLMGGQLPVAVDAVIPSGEQVKAGKVRALAILSTERSPLLPDVPTIAEAGWRHLRPHAAGQHAAACRRQNPRGHDEGHHQPRHTQAARRDGIPGNRQHTRAVRQLPARADHDLDQDRERQQHQAGMSP